MKLSVFISICFLSALLISSTFFQPAEASKKRKLIKLLLLHKLLSKEKKLIVFPIPIPLKIPSKDMMMMGGGFDMGGGGGYGMMGGGGYDMMGGGGGGGGYGMMGGGMMMGGY